MIELTELLGPALGHTQFGELGGDILPVRGGAHLLVDVENPAIHADVKRPARRERLVLVDDPVRGCHLTCGIAEKRVIDSQRLRERLVRLRRVDTDGEMRDVELTNGVATLTE